jgi:predicted ABC-type ATPase
VTNREPVLHVLAGPNGAGKTTFYGKVLAPVMPAVPFVNADMIAASRWPGDEMRHAHDAAAQAAEVRDRLLAQRRSFITETVFSHPSKVELIVSAGAAGYLVYLHVILVPVELALARVLQRVGEGGHDVPDEKVRERYQRLWSHVAAAIPQTYEATVYDAGGGRFVAVARYEYGVLVGAPSWPGWTPAALRDAACP